MGPLETLLALTIVEREFRNRRDGATKSALAALMRFHLLDGDATNLYIRKIDFLVTAGYLGTLDHLHYQLTPSGKDHLEKLRTELAGTLQMMTRSW